MEKEDHINVFKEPLENLRRTYEQLLGLEWHSFGELSVKEQLKVSAELDRKIAAALLPFYEAARSGIRPPVDELRKQHQVYCDRFIGAGRGMVNFTRILYPFQIWSRISPHFGKINYEYLLTGYVEKGLCNCDLMLEARTGEKPASDKLEELSSQNYYGCVEETVYKCGHCGTKWMFEKAIDDSGSNPKWLRYDL
jgi:hypothetical protein